jgi:hypothetical protein
MVRDDDISERRGAIVRRAQQVAQVGRTGLPARRPVQHPVQQVQHVPAAAARRNHRVHAIAVEHRADAIAVARQDPGEHRDELARHCLFLHVARAEVDRGAQVEQEPRGDLALLVVLAHVGRLQPRGDIPVDVPDVVAVHVLAQVGEVEPVAAKERPIVAVQHAVQAADTVHSRCWSTAQASGPTSIDSTWSPGFSPGTRCMMR